MTAATPTALPVDPGNLPAELRDRRQWVGWRWEPCPDRPGAFTKVPVNAHTGARASTTNPTTWATFADALAHATRHRLPGIGYVFAADDPFAGVDLDACRDPGTGVLTPEAAAIVDGLGSYAEASPSGRGVHVIVRGRVPGDRRRRGPIELYDAGRYFTMTGHRLPGTPATVESRQDALDRLYGDTFGPNGQEHHIPPPPMPGNGSPSLSDAEVIEKARAATNGAAFDRLFLAGDTAGHGGDDSAADLALLSHLSFWTQDAAQLDRLFRGSSLMRPKWERTDYRARSIAKALDRAEVWSPGPPVAVHGRRASGGNDGEEAPARHLTDLGNAERLVAHRGGDFRYVYAWQRWLAWDGRRWASDAGGAIRRAAKETVRGIYAEATEAPTKDAREATAKHAVRSEAAPKIEAMVALAQSEPGVEVSPGDLDRDRWLLNVANGTLDLRRGTLRPHERGDLLTKLVPVPYDPDAECPTWLAFLDRVLGGNADLIGFVQRAIGYALSGDTSERVVFILWGSGRNGKSTLLDTVLDLLADYAARTPTDTLLASRDGAIPNDVARLKGRRFVFASEAEEGRRLAEAKVKDLTGGDTISARFMRGEWFDFRPEFKLWFGTNHKPTVRGADDAIWDRIKLIPFSVRIPDAEQDKDLRAKLSTEAPGILAWAVAGCLAWRRDGLGEPAEVRAAVDAYRAESDVVGRFLDDCCVVHPDERATAKELYAAFQTWHGAVGEEGRPPSQKAIGLRLAGRGFDSARVGKGRLRSWVGLGLRPDHAAPGDDRAGGRTHSGGGRVFPDFAVNRPCSTTSRNNPENASARVRPPQTRPPRRRGRRRRRRPVDPMRGARPVPIIAHCRRCRTAFAPDHRAIAAGSWRLCPRCRDPESAEPAPGPCPTCGRWLKSGAHRGPCPGRGRRRRSGG